MGKCSFSIILGVRQMEFNEVFFNELCVQNKSLSFDNWKELIQAKTALGSAGFTVCRVSNNDYRSLMKSVTELKNPALRNIFFQFFHIPFETKEIEESEEKSTDFLEKEVLYNDTSAYGFSLAAYYDTFALSFATSEEWTRSKIQVTRNKDLLEIHHVSNKIHVNENADWLESRSEIELITTNIEPSNKIPNFRDDHGKDELDAFWKKIRNSEYVVSCINSLPFSSHNRNFIRNFYSDGKIEITLPWTDKGLGLVIQSTGRNRRESEQIAKLLEEKYSR